MIRALALAAALTLGTHVSANPAKEARTQLLAAADLLADAGNARDRVDALTEAVRAYEAGLQVLRSELRRLSLEERALRAALADEDQDLATILAVMQNATQQVKRQSLVHPGSAVDTIRAGTLASALLPELSARAARLEGQLTELSELRALIEAVETSVGEGLAGVQEARIALGTALRERRDLPPRLATNDAAMEALVNSAETVSALADSLASGAGAVAPTGLSAWQPPVRGSILAGFNPNENRPGWSISTEPGALLLSPTGVTVRFSDIFPDRGTVVILETDRNLLILLAGLSTSFVAQGEVLAAGDPVGLAGQGQSAAQDKLNAEEAAVSLFAEETVYIELRQGGAPIDPATHLTLEQEQG